MQPKIFWGVAYAAMLTERPHKNTTDGPRESTVHTAQRRGGGAPLPKCAFLSALPFLHYETERQTSAVYRFMTECLAGSLPSPVVRSHNSVVTIGSYQVMIHKWIVTTALSVMHL